MTEPPRPYRQLDENLSTDGNSGYVRGATVEVWPHGSDGRLADQLQGHVVDVVGIDGRPHLVVVFDDSGTP